MSIVFHKIILPTRLQPDTIVGIFLLKKFGEDKYPGISEAGIVISQNLPVGENSETLLQKGVLALDIGRGKLDHHNRGKNLSCLIAEDLGIENNPSIAKLLVYAERDDKFGKGTISTDQIDKAFGLSGLISSLNKTYPKFPGKIINLVLPILEAHYLEEKNRAEIMPREFEAVLASGKAEIFEVRQNGKKLKTVVLESDNLSMAGWLRSVLGIRADLVCQKISSGYVNILTRPLKRVDLKILAGNLRRKEAELRNRNLNFSGEEFARPGKFNNVPEWYYDRATNSILNGGTNPQGIEPTIISLDEIKNIIINSFK